MKCQVRRGESKLEGMITETEDSIVKVAVSYMYDSEWKKPKVAGFKNFSVPFPDDINGDVKIVVYIGNSQSNFDVQAGAIGNSWIDCTEQA